MHIEVNINLIKFKIHDLNIYYSQIKIRAPLNITVRKLVSYNL